MDFSDNYLRMLAVVLAVLMGMVEFVNWLNRKRGGFVRGWAGAIFIGVCWTAAMVFIDRESPRAELHSD
jgi:hypothetical protein